MLLHHAKVRSLGTLLSLVSAACFGQNWSETPTPERVTAENDGVLCIFGEGSAASVGAGVDGYPVGGALTFLVQTYYHEVCQKDVQAGCEAAIVDGTVKVTSWMSWIEETIEDLPCSGLVAQEARCILLSISEGSWSIVHGEDIYPFQVPSVASDTVTYDPEDTFGVYPCFVPEGGLTGLGARLQLSAHPPSGLRATHRPHHFPEVPPR